MAYGEFAKIYDELINEDINYEDMTKHILDICIKENVQFNDYLDLACGTGNVAVIIAKEFKNNYAVDLSEDMLRTAFEKFKENKIKAKVICQDMSELELNNNFDLITSVLDSTNYITDSEDLKNYFLGVSKHLKEDGLFIFDINSYYKLSEILGNNIYTYSEEEVFYTWENVFEEDLLSMYLTFFVKKGDLYERFEEEHLERAYTHEYIKEIISSSGLKLIGAFDGYSNNEVLDHTERIMYVCKKK